MPRDLNVSVDTVRLWRQRWLDLQPISLDDLTDAILAFDEVIRLDPEAADAWNNKGVALEALGRTFEASAAYAKAEELGL